jgi:adenosyl cobinamide kinase/adenosyl cobinamide phosphate guanylyltransferase
MAYLQFRLSVSLHYVQSGEIMDASSHRIMQVHPKDNEESRRLIRIFWDLHDTLRVYPETRSVITPCTTEIVELVAYNRFKLGFTVE